MASSRAQPSHQRVDGAPQPPHSSGRTRSSTAQLWRRGVTGASWPTSAVGPQTHRQLPTSLRKESRDVEEIGEFRTGVSKDRVEVRREHREISVDHPEVSREQHLTTTQITSF